MGDTYLPTCWIHFSYHFCRDKELFPQEKKDLDDKFNDTLKDCKRHSYVTDMIFQKVQENVGLKSSDDFNILEPLLATNIFISYQSVEANRLEVNLLPLKDLAHF